MVKLFITFHSVLFLILSSIFSDLARAETNTTHEACLAHGFNKDILRCNACDSIAKVIENSGLVEACKECCLPAISAPRETYQLIVLEIDQRFVGMYPEIMRGIQKQKENQDKHPFSFMTVRYSFGARPTLHLFKERDDELPTESVFVGSWNLDVLIDYIKECTQEV